MTLYLVRQAAAVRRAAWKGPERLRPLAGGGHRQARRLAERLRGAGIDRLLCAPLLRCRQTLEPFAASSGLPLAVEERLTGGDLDAVCDLMRSLEGANAVVCARGRVIEALVGRLCSDASLRAGELRCEKGSVWVLEGPPGLPESASYWPPPSRGRRVVEGAAPWSGAFEESPEPWEEAGKLRVAVLDLGSTSFHLLVADASPTGEIRRVLREREMLRLGAMIATRGHIPKKVCRRAVESARALRRHADDADVQRLLPVATAALRDARNGEALAEQLGEALGTPVRILSGAEEASLIFAAFRHRLLPAPGVTLGLDLGGGSLELALGDEREVHWEATLPLGVVRLHGEIARSDPMRPREERALRARVREQVLPHRSRVRRRASARCVVTGGTMSALARRVVARRSSWPARAVGQLFVPLAELAELRRELVASRHAERLATPGISKQRADLLPTGAVVLEAAARELGLPGLTVSDWGLREGVILEALGLTATPR